MGRLITMAMVADEKRFRLIRPTREYDKGFVFVKEGGICYEASTSSDHPQKRAMISPTDLVELEDTA